jgi:hypothetical protein
MLKELLWLLFLIQCIQNVISSCTKSTTPIPTDAITPGSTLTSTTTITGTVPPYPVSHVPTVTANPNRNVLCTDKFGSCGTFYTSDCVCVGQNMSIPYFSLSWAVHYSYFNHLKLNLENYLFFNHFNRSQLI